MADVPAPYNVAAAPPAPRIRGQTRPAGAARPPPGGEAALLALKAKLGRLAPGRRGLVLAGAAALVLGYLALAGQREQPVLDHIVVTARVSDPPVYYVKPKHRDVSLTFDISWGTKTAPKVLDILRRHGVKATFFLSGPWAEHHPEIVRAIVADGHEIASHGQEHWNLSQYDGDTVRRNIQSAHEILKRLSGQEPRFFRPPNGDFDDLVVRTARELGYETIIWSVDSLDWKNPGADYMTQRVTRLVFPGAIILFHASDSSRQVDAALPAVIENLRRQGYRLVTLGELFRNGTPMRVDPRGRPDYPPVRPEDVPPPG